MRRQGIGVVGCPRRTGEGVIDMQYEAPSITEVGSVRELTLAEGLAGKDDRFWFFAWGTDPKPGGS